jgi:hypothetical protein
MKLKRGIVWLQKIRLELFKTLPSRSAAADAIHLPLPGKELAAEFNFIAEILFNLLMENRSVKLHN